MELYEYDAETGYLSIRNVPKYSILETVEDRITGTVWHKLKTNEKAARLILALKATKSFDIHTEPSGKSFIWVTDKLLTLLHIQGVEPVHS